MKAPIDVGAFLIFKLKLYSMKLQFLTGKEEIADQVKGLLAQVHSLNRLILAANAHNLPDEFVADFNSKIGQLSSIQEPKALKKGIWKVFTGLQNQLRSEYNLVTPDFYRNLWLGLGMAALGIPFGVAFSAALGNFAFIGIGLPIGLAMGIAIGTSLDKKAKNEGRVLEV